MPTVSTSHNEIQHRVNQSDSSERRQASSSVVDVQRVVPDPGLNWLSESAADCTGFNKGVIRKRSRPGRSWTPTSGSRLWTCGWIVVLGVVLLLSDAAAATSAATTTVNPTSVSIGKSCVPVASRRLRFDTAFGHLRARMHVQQKRPRQCNAPANARFCVSGIVFSKQQLRTRPQFPWRLNLFFIFHH